MKEKFFKILGYVHNVFVVTCISSFFIELILLFFFSDAAARHPKGVLDTINISLICIFFFSLLIIIIIPEEVADYIKPKVQKSKELQ